MSVLIVDDDKMTLRLLRTILKHVDIDDVEEATDGLDALEKLRTCRFKAILSDWHMQPMNGFELLQHVRGDCLLANLPFIMITAECAPERIATARRAGVSGYIVKPFDAEALTTMLQTVCAHG